MAITHNDEIENGEIVRKVEEMVLKDCTAEIDQLNHLIITIIVDY